MNTIKKIIFILFVITCTVALVVLAINVHMINYSSEFIFDSLDDLKTNIKKPVQSVIVLGAYVYSNGQPCPMLEDRLLTGIDVLSSKAADTILLSGDHGTRGYDEVNSMKAYTFDMGIAKESVFLDHAGFSTYDSVIRASDIFLIESAVLSTQKYHLTRAVYTARKMGIEAYGISADRRTYPRSEMAGYQIREWLARTKDFIFINILKPDPVYGGEQIPITGDSRISYDKPEDLE